MLLPISLISSSSLGISVIRTLFLVLYKVTLPSFFFNDSIIVTDLSTSRKRYWLGVSGDTEWERLAGLTFPGTYALTARRYFHEFDSTHDDLVHVSVKNHMHGFENEVAHLRKEVSFDKAKSGFMVADPLTLYDCCPTSDGASAVILVADHLAHKFTDTPIWVKGSGAGSDHLALHDRPSLTQLREIGRAHV